MERDKAKHISDLVKQIAETEKIIKDVEDEHTSIKVMGFGINEILSCNGNMNPRLYEDMKRVILVHYKTILIQKNQELEKL